MRLSGLIPARFLTLIAHLVITIVLFWAKDANIKACLPGTYTQDQYRYKDVQIIIGLSVALGLFTLELIGFLGGISMFMPLQGMISTAAHASASVTLAFFLFDAWHCDLYWYIFGFCCAFPAVTEIIVMIGVLAFRKGI